MMKANVLFLVVCSLLSGCSSVNRGDGANVNYSTDPAPAVCAALGQLKITHNDKEFIKASSIVKNRIAKHNFNITASACSDMAQKAMIAYMLNKQIAMVSDLPCVPEITAKT